MSKYLKSGGRYRPNTVTGGMQAGLAAAAATEAVLARQVAEKRAARGQPSTRQSQAPPLEPRPQATEKGE